MPAQRPRRGPSSSSRKPTRRSWRDRIADAIRQPGRRALAISGTVLLAALTAVFVTIAENAGSRIAENIGLDPAPTPQGGGATSAAAFSTAVVLDLGTPPELLALPEPLTGGAELSRLTSGEADDDLGGFLDHNHGAPIADLTVSLTLTGHRSPSVLINSIEIRKMSTTPPMTGTLIFIPTQGEVPVISLSVDLDPSRPVLRNAAGPYFPSNSISLKDGEQQPLRIAMTAKAATYQFLLVIGFVDASGEQRTVYVDRLGHQFASVDASRAGDWFRLTAPVPRYGVAYKRSSGRPGFSLDPSASMRPS